MVLQPFDDFNHKYKYGFTITPPINYLSIVGRTGPYTITPFAPLCPTAPGFAHVCLLLLLLTGDGHKKKRTSAEFQQIEQQQMSSHKRALYCTSREERDAWVQALTQGARSFSIDKFYRLGKQIGQGRFSTVHIGKQLHTGKKFAVKIINKRKILEDEKAQEALRIEIAILKLVRHPGNVTCATVSSITLTH